MHSKYDEQVGLGSYTIKRDEALRLSHFNVIIGYPGAGKTTIGTDFPYILRRYWESRKAEQDLSFLNVEDFEAFKKMIDMSLHYNCCLYHSLLENGGGKLIGIELQLAEKERYLDILALRLLHASISCLDSSIPYESMLQRIASLADNVHIQDVLFFMRKGLNIPDDNFVFFSLFLDEINAANPILGKTTTWVQEAISAYIQGMHFIKRTNTFLMMTVATTNYNAASLKLKSKFKVVPVFPLTPQAAEEVVGNFVQRLARSLGEEPPKLNECIRLCIKVTGGMPRVLSWLVRGLVNSDEQTFIEPRDLLKAFKEFGGYQKFKCVHDNILKLLDWKVEKYRQGKPFKCLLSALRTCLLEEQVCRSNPVHSEHDITWGNLEEAGLVGLKDILECPTRNLGDTSCTVVFPPFLLQHLADMSMDLYSFLLPNYMERGFRSKEEGDMRRLIFMIYLFREMKNQQSFRLADIVPKCWSARPSLLGSKFSVPMNLGQICHCRQKISSGGILMAFQNDGYCGVLGPGNNGLDSAVVLDEAIFIIQSKSFDDSKARRSAKATEIFWGFVKDLKGVVQFNATGTDLSTFPKPVNYMGDDEDYVRKLDISKGQGTKIVTRGKRPRIQQYVNLADTEEDLDEVVVNYGDYIFLLEKLVYVYSTDEEVTEEERAKILSSDNLICSRIVITKHSEDNALDLLSKCRHLFRFPVKHV